MRKMPSCFNSKWLMLLLSIFVFLSDQISKFFVVKFFQIGDSSYIFSFFNIVRVQNKGITFGMLSETTPPSILILLSAIVMVSLLIWAKTNIKYLFPVSMIVSGALGNLIDRILYGSVVDFLDFHISKYHWPAFNIADSSIVIGTFILFLISYKEEGRV